MTPIWIGTPARLAGAALMLACVLLFEPGGAGTLQRLWLPLSMGIAAALILQNVLGVLLAGVFLAAVHMNAGGDWIAARAYPLILALCLLAVSVILLQRFRSRIAATREARWQSRGAPAGKAPARSETSSTAQDGNASEGDG